MKKNKIKIGTTNWGHLEINLNKKRIIISTDMLVECLKSNKLLLKILLSVYLENGLMHNDEEAIELVKRLKDVENI